MTSVISRDAAYKLKLKIVSTPTFYILGWCKLLILTFKSLMRCKLCLIVFIYIFQSTNYKERSRPITDYNRCQSWWTMDLVLFILFHFYFSFLFFPFILFLVFILLFFILDLGKGCNVMFSVTELWHMLQSQFLPSCDIEKDIEGSGTNNII